MSIIRIHCSDDAVAASPPDLFGLMADVERFSIEVPIEDARVPGAGAPVLVCVTRRRRGEAALIAEFRRDVAQAVGLTLQHSDRHAVLVRYRELLTAARAKAAANALPLHSKEGLQT